MTCESCGTAMTKGFLSTSHDFSTFALDWMEGEIDVGKSGVRGAKERKRIPLLAWACTSCGRVVFGLTLE